MKKQTPRVQTSKRLVPILNANPSSSRPTNKNLATPHKPNSQTNNNSTNHLDIDKVNGQPNLNKLTGRQNSPNFVVNHEIYDEKKIRELLQTNNVLSQEIEELHKKISEKDFHIRHLTNEVNDLRQNYDKVKSVLYQKSQISESKTFDRSESSLRSKKQVVYGESFSSSSVEIKIHEKSESATQLIEMAIKNCQDDFLKKLEPQQIKQICQCMYSKTVKANVFIIQEGEPGYHMYVLASGKMEVIKDGKKLRDMYPGELFGELAVLQNCLRTASVKAVSEASFWTIERKVYQSILQKSNMQQSAEYKKFLQSVSLFKNLSHEELNKIVDALMMEEYSLGEHIVREGEEGQTFFIIKNGKVKVFQKVQGSEELQEIRTLTSGDYFGERALLKNEIRTATVTADSDIVEVLLLDREDFNRLIGHNYELNSKEYNDIKMKTQQPSTVPIVSTKKDEVVKSPYQFIQKKDLEIITTLGVGGFGKVELVRLKNDHSLVFALKSLSKQNIVEMKQEEHIISERKILLEVKFPFICELYRTFRDNKYVYMLMEACLGGEIWTLLRNKTVFDDRTTKFILGSAILAIQYLHSKCIIYRDLKPENMVFDNRGFVKLCDFGFAKYIGNGKKTFTFCGTPEYVAPELILNKGHDAAVDIWAIGILTFELLTGSPAFVGDEPMKVYNKILNGIEKIEFGRKINRTAVQFIKMLCKDNPTERLGFGRAGISAIMNHKYFIGFNWDALLNKEMTPVIIPKLENNIDTHYFDQFTETNYVPPDETSGWDDVFEL